MIRRLLVAVDDSAPALAAARFAIELADFVGADLDVATVAEAGRDPDAILQHVRSMAERAGVDVSVTTLGDEVPPFEALLARAERSDVDLVVMGRSDHRSTGRPYVGSQTEHLLEFTRVPVVVVPEGAVRAR
jgi:nucleotide-binding universal stress UspA family protein